VPAFNEDNEMSEVKLAVDESKIAVVSSGWRPMETAPKDGNSILIRRGDSCRVAYWEDADDEADGTHMWHVDDAAKGFNHHKDWPTHWMPLPL
jgi:hypothetical protein